MSKLILNDELRAQVNGMETSSEVCDTAGNLIGHLVSPAKYAQLQRIYEEWEEADIAELDRIAPETEVYTLKEIWKELGVE